MDQAFNGDGPEIDEGPLDPSVFFGLFDDLVDGADPESDSPDEPDADADHGDRAEDQATEANGDVVLLDITRDTVVIDTVEDDGAADNGRPGATVTWRSTAPDGPATNGVGTAVSSPPPAPPTAECSEPVLGVDTVEIADHVIDGKRDTVDQSPPVIDRGVDEGGTVAKAALATIAVGLFAGLIVAFVLSLRGPDPALDGSAAAAADGGDPAASTVIDEAPTGLAGAMVTGARPTAEVLAGEFSAALESGIAGRVDLTSLRFEPGTTEVDERSAAVVAELGALLADRPAVPVTIAVRTYTESTPAENLALSVDQAEALAASLVAAGAAPDQVRSGGLGAAPLSQAQPVPNFVVLTPAFGDRRFNDVLRSHSPFALGLPATAVDGAWPLRPDGLLAIGELADSLSAFPDAEVGAAGYSFLPPSQAGIRAEADAAATELADFLVSASGFDADRVTTIIPGSAVFVPTPEHGNHIWLQIGPASRGAFDVASIDPATITFAPGSAELDAVGTATVQALADILTTGGATIVVDVRSYESADAAADQALSEARRDALAEALTAAGVSPGQLRLYASGASSYLLDDGGPTITITVAP